MWKCAAARRFAHRRRPPEPRFACTPKGGIVNTGELLKEILAEKEPAAAALADSLFTLVDEMGKLIGQIRVITKASADPKPKACVNMAEIVSGVVQRLESRILNSSAKVTEPGSWPEVNGVADWLEFIWWNFLANTLQHAGEMPQIELKWHRQKNGLCFQVCDNGVGVPAEVRARLFQLPDSSVTNRKAAGDWDCPLCKGWSICRAATAATSRIPRAARVFILHCRREKAHRFWKNGTVTAISSA